MIHADAVNLIRLAISEAGGVAIPTPAGGLRDGEGRLMRFGMPGQADVHACYRGRFFAVEAKVGRDPWRPEQKKYAAAVERAGGIYVLARWNEHKNGIDTLVEELKRCLLSL